MQIADWQIIYLIRDGLICMTALICMVGTAVLIQRQQYKTAVLLIAGLAFLSLEPIADFVVWQILALQEIEGDLLDLLFAIPSGLGMIGGLICLTAAALSATRPFDNQPEAHDLTQ